MPYMDEGAPAGMDEYSDGDSTVYYDDGEQSASAN